MNRPKTSISGSNSQKMNSLKESFVKLASNYCQDVSLVNKLWKQLEQAYSEKKRYYHTLSHLYTMFRVISNYEDKLANKDAVLFAVWLHDIVYDSSISNNEEKSADVANDLLEELTIPDDIIEEVVKLILLTKTHTSENLSYDEKLFLDADLSILGSSPEEYAQYTEQVRKEYSQYPDIIYNPGRKKILHHFLNQTQIYKTEELYHLLESQARKNLQSELNQLSL